MEMMNLGRTGFNVSRLCFGCWQASGWSSSNDQGFTETLLYALDRGINFLDTAPAYGNGHSEELVGRAIAGRRERIILATKLPHAKGAPQQVRQSIEGSLRRLRTDYIDLYQQHWPPPSPPLQETIAELEKLKAEGKIKAIGVSNWMEPEWSEIDRPDRIECLQACYSLLWRSIEKEVLPLCLKEQIAVIAYSPLCQGILAGKFRKLEEVPDDFRKNNRFVTAGQFPAVASFVGKLAAIAERLQKPAAAVALRWVLERQGLVSAIVGASSPAQVDQNLQALGWKLPSSEKDELDALSAPFSAGIKPHDSLWNWHPREKVAKFS